jgi:hypothetical protein
VNNLTYIYILNEVNSIVEMLGNVLLFREQGPSVCEQGPDPMANAAGEVKTQVELKRVYFQLKLDLRQTRFPPAATLNIQIEL